MLHGCGYGQLDTKEASVNLVGYCTSLLYFPSNELCHPCQTGLLWEPRNQLKMYQQKNERTQLELVKLFLRECDYQNMSKKQGTLKYQFMFGEGYLFKMAQFLQRKPSVS